MTSSIFSSLYSLYGSSPLTTPAEALCPHGLVHHHHVQDDKNAQVGDKSIFLPQGIYVDSNSNDTPQQPVSRFCKSIHEYELKLRSICREDSIVHTALVVTVHLLVRAILSVSL
jgi:hypothetical protein